MAPGQRGGAARAGAGVGATASPDRYQGLEQRLEAELQAAATSKEEALRELKTRALQLEEELVQVRQAERGSLVLPRPPSCLPASRAARAPVPPAPCWSCPLIFGPSLAWCPIWGHLGECPVLGGQADSAQVLESSGALEPCFPHSSGGHTPAAPLGGVSARLCFSRASPLPSDLGYCPCSWLTIVSEAPSSGLSSGVWGGPRAGKDTGHHNTGCQGTVGPQQSPW